MTFSWQIKYADLTERTYNTYTGADPATTQVISDASTCNYFTGNSVGTNGINVKYTDGLSNRYQSYNDKKYFNEHGYYPKEPSFIRFG